MRIVLTDKNLDGYTFSPDVKIQSANVKNLRDYDHDKDVVAVVGSRGMASVCDSMDLPTLKLFQLTSAGFDGVPCESFAQKGIAVANAGGVYSAPIAETVVLGILLMAKKLRKNPNNRLFKLTRHYDLITELYGKKALIMGAGNIGTAVADRLVGFDMTVDGYDPYCEEKKPYGRILRTRDELTADVGEYDFIVSTLPDNEHTKKFIDKELFDSMKKTAVIVNVGRKAVFNEKDFFTALKKKHIGGAVLDMFEKIPNPITNKFRRLRNVIVLPGISAISKEVNVRLREHIYKNITACLSSKEVLDVINGVK